MAVGVGVGRTADTRIGQEAEVIPAIVPMRTVDGAAIMASASRSDDRGDATTPGSSEAVSLLTKGSPDMSIRNIAGCLLAASVSACSSSGDTAALLTESARSCSAVCTEHPNMESVSYEAGGGSPLLFSGRIAVRCDCSDAGR